MAEPHNCNGTGCDLLIPNVLGGGSAVNAMMYVRGSDADYDGWAKMAGDDGWKYENVLPYFKQLENNDGLGWDTCT